MSHHSILPKVKKKLSAFISSEQGSVSKQSLLTIGTFVGTAAIAGVMAARNIRANQLTIQFVGWEGGQFIIRGHHAHHASHSSHSSR
jgi:hypothetical protein